MYTYTVYKVVSFNISLNQTDDVAGSWDLNDFRSPEQEKIVETKLIYMYTNTCIITDMGIKPFAINKGRLNPMWLNLTKNFYCLELLRE